MRMGYVDTLLGQLHYRRMGSGDPVYLVGQSGRSSHMQDGLVRRLASRYDVTGIDLFGTGHSSPLEEGTSYEEIAEGLLQSIERLGLGQVHLYGIHSGNKIAVSMAVQAPASVRTLALVGQSHSIIPDQARRNDLIGRVATTDRLDHPADVLALVEWTNKMGQIQSYALSRQIVAGILQTGHYDQPLGRLIDELQGLKSRHALYGANYRYDLAADLVRVEARTLVLEVATKAEDREIGRQGPAVVSLLQHGQLETLEVDDGIHTLEDHVDQLATILCSFFG